MGAPRSRGKPRKRSVVKPPPQPLRNDMVTIFVTFRATGPFEITFAPYGKNGNTQTALSRFPILAFSVLRTQLLEVHKHFWITAGLPVNPTIVSDQLVRPGDSQAGLRREYVNQLCEWFNTACKQQDVKAIMMIARTPQKKPAKKAATSPKTTTSASATAASTGSAKAQKATKKVVAKKVVKKTTAKRTTH